MSITSLRTYIIVFFLALFSAVSCYGSDLSYSDGRVLPGLEPVVKTGSGVYYPSGTYYFDETDLRVAARSIPMVWDRYYRSNRVVKNSEGKWSFDLPVDGPLGFGWHNTWLCRIEGDRFKTASGRYIEFSKDANGNYLPNSGAGFTLLKKTDGYELLESNGFTYRFDTSGKLTSIQDRSGNRATLGYDGDGKLTTITDTAGRTIFTLSYTPAGRIATVTDIGGRIVSYTYNSYGDLTEVRHGATLISSYTYNASNGITRKTNAVGDSYTIQYYPKWENKGIVQKVTDPAGTSASFSYDFTNRIFQITDYNGITTKHYLNADGKLLQSDELDADGKSVPRNKIEYLSGRIIKVTDILGNVTQTQTDEWGNTISSKDADGNEWRSSYDSNRQLVSTTNPLGIVTRYEYDANGNRTKEIIAAGTADESIGSYTYNSNRELLTSNNNGAITRYEYDANGNQTKLTDPLGNVTSLTYDLVGNLISQTIPGIGTTTYADHDFNGNPAKITDPAGITTSYTYNQAGRTLSTTNLADNSITRYSYIGVNNGSCTSCGGGIGKIASVILPEGNRLSYSYTATGQIATISDNDGNSIVYSYDRNNNKIKEEIKDLGGVLQKTVSHQYDLLNRLTKTITPDQGETIHAYDKRGNRITQTNPNNNSTSYSYDQAGRLIKVTQPGGGTISYSYDRRNNLTSVTDANTITTSYDYDKQNRLIKTTSPDSGITSYTYDLNGNLKTKTDAKGITATYSYDNANRLTKIEFPDPKDNVSYSYDSCINGKGRLCSMTDPAGTTTYDYTQKGQVSKETRTIDSTSFVTQYSYDKNGNTTSITYPSGRIVSYGYTSDKVTQLLNNGAALASAITYKPFGNITGLTFGNGIQQTNSYDQQYRLTQITAQGIQNLGYSYDKNSNITQITDNLDTTKTKTYGYDSLDRLTTASGPWGSLSYSYDQNGNRTTETKNSATTNYSYKPSTNQLASTTGDKNYSFTFDQNGNTQTENTKNYTYNQNQRLIKVAEGTTTKGEYLYNANGQRIKKTANNQTSYFIFDQQGQLIHEAGASQADYVYLNGSPIAKIENSAIQYIHSDHLGTPQKMTDASKQLTWEISSLPFGETTGIAGTASNNLRFPGQYADVETNLHYNYYRDYNPSIGRYIQSDPLLKDIWGTHVSKKIIMHNFIYSYSRPIVLIDKYGLFANGTSMGVDSMALLGGGYFSARCCDGKNLWMIRAKKFCGGLGIGFFGGVSLEHGDAKSNCPNGYGGASIESSIGPVSGGSSLGSDWTSTGAGPGWGLKLFVICITKIDAGFPKIIGSCCPR